MFNYIFIVLLTVHGLIHILGFFKAYDFAQISQLSTDISKPVGLIWLIASILFIATSILVITQKDLWWIIALVAVTLSQVLIILSWSDAKIGTIPNVLILFVIIVAVSSYLFENKYQSDVSTNFNRIQISKNDNITEQDLKHLPEPVANYLKYVGVVGKPKLQNVYVELDGQMREKDKDYFTFTAEQYNFFQNPSRLFFMKGKMFGTSVPGYHKYMDDKASMDIRLLGILSVVKHEDLFQAETVTFFNDMCLLAPARLIDKDIKWHEIDNQSARAKYTNKGTTISATLYFNEKGELTNFVSDDRTAVSDMKKYRFSTPISQYKDFDGYILPSYGEAIWHYPEGEFVYGKINIKNVKYNVKNK